MRKTMMLTTLICGTMLAGCATPKGSTPGAKQDYIRAMRDQTLDDLYATRPDLEPRVENAAGYAVFSNVNIHGLVVNVGQGYGVAVNNETGKETFMKMATLGAGFGAGLRDLRAVFIFGDEGVFHRFIYEGWEFSSDAEAAAASEDKGGAAGAYAAAAPGSGTAGTEARWGASDSDYSATRDRITTYRVTKAGVAAQAALTGTKYWRDPDLN